MNQAKIGRFIAECRKNKNLTQMQLAEKLKITDRAISKWENGKSLPDASIMLELCNILDITVNELLSGEFIMKNEYNEKLEQNLLEMVKQKEISDRRLLKMEIVIGITVTLLYIILVFVACFAEISNWIRFLLISLGIIPFLIGIFFAVKIEQVAGYYHCEKCGHKYVPTYKSVLFSMHINRTRYMKCPNCGKKSWQKKVINK